MWVWPLFRQARVHLELVAFVSISALRMSEDVQIQMQSGLPIAVNMPARVCTIWTLCPSK